MRHTVNHQLFERNRRVSKLEYVLVAFFLFLYDKQFNLGVC